MEAADAATLLFSTLCAERIPGAKPLAAGVLETIEAAARRHGLAPLLYWHLVQPGPAPPATPSDFPPQSLHRLRNAYFQGLRTSLALRDELAALARALGERGISPVLLKGAHLAFGVYPDPGLRTMHDVDLLVEREAVPAAAAALHALGYRPLRPYDLESEFATWHHLPPFGKPGQRFVEIHWALLRPEEPYRIDTAALLARARPAGIPGLGVRVLDSADLLLHLCLHAAAVDGFAGGLRQLVDIVFTLRRFHSDAALLEAPRRAASWGATRPLSLTLHLCADLAPSTALPPPLLRHLAPSPPDPAAINLARSLVLAPADTAAGVSRTLARALEAGPAGSAAAFARRCFPGKAQLSTLYGVDPRSPAIWPCYPRRWLDLLRQHLPAALRTLAGGSVARAERTRRDAENHLSDWLSG